MCTDVPQDRTNDKLRRKLTVKRSQAEQYINNTYDGNVAFIK